MTDTQKEQFDENKANLAMNKYSRQIGTFGVETMKKLTQLAVLIVGAKGVGVETAKNTILAGPARVDIYDNHHVEIADLGTNFFFTEKDVGRKRSESCASKLAPLNSDVKVHAYTGEITDDYLKQFGAVVVTDNTPLDLLIKWGNICRANHSLFLIAVTNGLTGTVFADFGAEHTTTDLDGEPERVNVIEKIEIGAQNVETKKYPVTITTSAEKHGLDDDEHVKIEGVVGIPQFKKLNDAVVKRVYADAKDEKTGKPRKVIVTNKISIELDECSGKYENGGTMTALKPKQVFKFKTFEESFKNPKIKNDKDENDPLSLVHPHSEKWIMFSRAEKLHTARVALWEFQRKHGKLPGLHNEKDANEVVEIAKTISAELKKTDKNEDEAKKWDVDETVVKNTALYAHAELPGLTAFLGGVAAQEIVKKFGKYTPIHQWIHVDYFELLDEKQPTDLAAENSRYDHQIAIFGKEFQKKLGNQKWFIVGTGALGCEYLKGFALMGIACDGGVLYCTDNDRIEVSNLNRQFLFRKDNLGKPKSVTASSAAKVMNPHLNVKAFEIAVGTDTENVFNDTFWSSLDGVCNALDNVGARKYVDSKCVFFEKPLLESGTLGTKSNSEIVIPHKTPSYSEHKDVSEETSIPMCTLRNFPSLIEHCIEWSRAQFSEMFEEPAKEVLSLAQDVNAYFEAAKKEGDLDAQLEKLQIVKSLLESAQNVTFESCVKVAFDQFIKQYRDRIRNLTNAFPANATKTDPVTKQEVPFWTGAKKFPRHVEFDIESKLHYDYLYATANLIAYMYNVDQVRDEKQFKDIVTKLNLKAPEWKPTNKKINLFEKDTNLGREEAKEEDIKLLTELQNSLKNFDFGKIKPLRAADFEKDDDENYHIDFITAASNLRAWNYFIPEASRHQAKMIAGKIIPAVATTTAMITGLIEMELYKIVKGLPKDKFCSGNVNLGTSSYQLFEPPSPHYAEKEYDQEEMADVIPVPDKFTTWDKIVIDKGDLTVSEFVKLFPSVHHGVSINFLEKANKSDKGTIPIYVSFPITEGQKKHAAESKDKKLSVVYEQIYGPINANYLLLSGSFENEDGAPVKIPKIKYVFKH